MYSQALFTVMVLVAIEGLWPTAAQYVRMPEDAMNIDK